MGVVIVIAVIAVVVAIWTMLANGRTAMRRSANERSRTSLLVRSEQSRDPLEELVIGSLVRAGAKRGASFDDRTYLTLAGTEIHVEVSSPGAGAIATVALGSTRSIDGRPQRLAPLARAIDQAANDIQHRDPTAKIT